MTGMAGSSSTTPSSAGGHRAAQVACDRLAGVLERSLAAEARGRPDDSDAVAVPLVRHALAVVRMRLRPALEPHWAERDPVHIAMFGGTNSGKSTVLNLLLGRAAAGMSARARFSQHPEAYRSAGLGDRFLLDYPSRFAGYDQYHDQHPPRQDDRELRLEGYRPALALNDPDRIEGKALTRMATPTAVLWDIPDFSTEEAATYLDAVLDTTALADLVVMAVTRENYADHRGALLRSLVIDSGVPLRVAANKLDTSGGALLADIRVKLGDEAVTGGRSVPAERVHPLPFVRRDDETARLAALLITPEATALRAEVAREVATGVKLKRDALLGAVHFLERRLDAVLAPLASEVATAARWSQIVDHTTQTRFYGRYRTDYLDAETYSDFNQTLAKLIDLLEVPGIGTYITALSKGVKSVSRFVVGRVVSLARSAAGKPAPSAKLPEEEAVIAAFQDWYDALKAEAQLEAGRGSPPHPAWGQIVQTLQDPGFFGSFVETLAAAYADYRQRLDTLTTERAQALYKVVAQNPKLLNALRGLKLTLDVGTTGMIVASHGLDWTDAVIGPLVAPAQRLLLEYGLQKYLDAERAKLRQQQFTAFQDVIEARMVAPVRALFVGEATADDVARARTDFALVREALLSVGRAGSASQTGERSA